MRIDIHLHFYPEPKFDVTGLAIFRELNMVSAEIQKILDQARESTSLVQSVHLGMQGLKQQVADMKAKIDSLPAGNVLGDDDKAALQEAAGQLDNTINMLKSDIPANTVADDGTPSTGQQSQGEQPSGGEGQPASAQGSDGGTARPLPGTGQG